MKVLRFIFFSFSVVFSSCSFFEEMFSSSETKNWKESEIVKVSLKFEASTSSINIEKLGLKITPIDSDSMDLLCRQSLSNDGSLLKLTSSLESRQSKDLSSEEKRKNKMFEAMVNDLQKLTQNNKLNNIEANLIFNRALMLEGYGNNSYVNSLIDILPTNSVNEETNFYNPFLIGGNPLSVIRIEFMNSDVLPRKIKHSDFQVISSNGELLQPLSNQMLKDGQQSFGPEKVKNLSRFNMPDELLLPPGQRVIKYLAFPAFANSANEISVAFLDDGKVITTKFSMDRKETKITKRYSESYIYATNYLTEKREEVIYIIKFKDEYFTLGSDVFFISDDDLNEKIKVIAADYNTYGDLYIEVLEGIAGELIDRKSEIKIRLQRVQ